MKAMHVSGINSFFCFSLLTFMASAVSLSIPQTAFGRSVYLNGQDVSSARNQVLKRVNVRIDENGDVFIEAPHYQVNEERAYAPLNTSVPTSTPSHENRGPIPDQLAKRPEKLPLATDKVEAKPTDAPNQITAPASDAPKVAPATPTAKPGGSK